MSKGRILAEYWVFLKYYKKLWLFPILATLLLFGLLLCAAQISTIAPFVYMLF